MHTFAFVENPKPKLPLFVWESFAIITFDSKMRHRRITSSDFMFVSSIFVKWIEYAYIFPN